MAEIGSLADTRPTPSINYEDEYASYNSLMSKHLTVLVTLFTRKNGT